MLILLPPSETKRPGGDGAPLDTGRLRFASLGPARDRAVEALVALSEDPDTAARVLKLSERQRGEIAVNAALRSAPTMPAADRYTGVLFDALDASSLEAPARTWLGEHVAIHAAPFGLVGALDPIPAYRLGAAASVPGLGPLRRLWADAVTSALAAEAPAFVLDLRSAAYIGLGPLPDGIAHLTPRIVSVGEDGVARALNHFNKHAKGALVRRLASEGPEIRSQDDFVAWADSAGVDLREHAGAWDLVA